MKIAHLADIHIRLKERHQEYREVFDRLYEDLREQNVDHIVLAGDIVHSKITMSPELFDLTRDFFQTLMSIAPLHIITGNHDMNMSNMERMDALTPVVDACYTVPGDDQRLFYYKNTDLYEVPNSNLVFGVNSLLDGKTIRLTKNMKTDEKIYIALYHGAIAGCVLDNEYTYEDAKVSPQTFRNFDYVMLGDIHKRQNEFRPDGTMAYCGTLIQQNHGEELDKGYLLWHIKDAKEYKAEFRKIKNRYGFYTIKADDGKLPNLELPEKTRMRVIWPVSANDISKNEIIKLNSMINKKYNPTSLQLLFRPVAGKTQDQLEFDGMINVNDFSIQQDLLRKWARVEGLDQLITEDLCKLDEEIHDKVYNAEFEDFTNCSWSLKSITMENFMSYGPEVSIDFSKTPGVVGLFGDNAVGKSVIIDGVLYALFNKITRNVKNEDLVNKYTNNNICRVILELKIKGIEYRLERWTTRNYQKRSGNFVGARTDVDLKRKVGDHWETLTETQRTETEKIIRNAIGTYEDFITTTLSTQNGVTEFINQRPALRAHNMLKTLGLDIFIKKYEYAKDILRKYDYEIENFKRDAELEKMDLQLEIKETLENNLVTLTERFNETQQQIQNLNTKIIEINSQIQSDVKINESIDQLEENVANLEQALEELEDRKVGIQAKIDSLYVKVRNIEDTFVLDDESLVELGQNKNIADEINSQLSELTNEITSKKGILSIYKNDIESGNQCPVIDDSRHMTCGYLKDFVVKKEKCTELIVEVKELLKKRDNLIEELKKYSDAEQVLASQEMIREKLVIAAHKMQEFVNMIDRVKNEIEVKTVSLKLAKSLFETAKEQKEIIENNIRLRGSLAEVEYTKGEKELFLETLGDELDIDKNKLILVNVEIENIQNSLSRIEEIEEIRHKYTVYCSAMHREGIPMSVLRQYIPKVNFEINKMLSNVVPFGVYLKIDELTNINIVMRYEGEVDDTRPASMASGMERLLINFAIRYALISVTNLNKPNVWMIDEGFGVLDSNNLYSISKFFENTRDIFENIIIITHIDELKDVANWVFNIEKKDGISCVLPPQKNI